MNIGIIGGLGSGKSTIANYLFENYGYQKMSLADPMRQIARDIFNIHDKTDSRYRVLMQKLGTDWFRSFDPDVWVKYLKRRINNVTWEYKGIVVDDVRFLNEAEALLDWGWTLLYLDCPVEIRKQRCLSRDGNFDEKALEHQSEKEAEQIKRELSSRLIILDASIPINEVPHQINAVMRMIGND
jgi:dephospho-CoA kinase